MRIAAIQRFKGSDFSVVLIAPRRPRTAVEAFALDIIHSHDPSCFVRGLRSGPDAGRAARVTHRTMDEHYPRCVLNLALRRVRSALRYRRWSRRHGAPTRVPQRADGRHIAREEEWRSN